ncbi:WXG100 family type VII secretion target [Nonomuraea sp. 3N208]|uniref:WXG100 family type VII secretion target n=1 Tax=Nonomuraea sp. 3N208 TaxID=3457421 RepID=UPI003FCD08D2
MSIYKEMYLGAAATAIGAALLIRSSWASYVAAAIGTMVSDPEGMTDAAMSWRTTDQSGSTAELDQLETQLDSLKTQLQEEGTWEGEAFNSFATIHTSFKESVQQLKETRNSTGEAVDSSADFFRWGAIACTAIAGFMLIVAISKWASNLGGPIGRAAGWLWEKAAGQATLTITKAMLKRHGIAIAALGGLLYMLKAQTESTGKIFPTLEAMPTQMTALESGDTIPFTYDGMIYEEGAGLVPTGDYSTTDPTGGGGGGGGGGAADFK